MADLLEPIFELLDAHSLVSAGFVAGGEWALAVPAFEGLKFNAVLAGEAHLLIEGRTRALLLKTGDCFMLSTGAPFVLTSDMSAEPIAADVVFAQARNGTASLGTGRDFHVIGGKMVLDDLTAPLLVAELPDVIVMRNGSPGAETVQWLLTQFVKEIASEQAGSGIVAASLMQLMFIELIRFHLTSTTKPKPGWLAAQSDRRIGIALRLMHADPGHAWSLAELAHACAMSRSNFASLFKAKVGLPALDYLLRWRMQLARRQIRRSSTPLAVIAERYGYSSESAFGHAFKRVFGMTPGAVRSL
jgi:AraC-like DNA-binding protein